MTAKPLQLPCASLSSNRVSQRQLEELGKALPSQGTLVSFAGEATRGSDPGPPVPVIVQTPDLPSASPCPSHLCSARWRLCPEPAGAGGARDTDSCAVSWGREASTEPGDTRLGGDGGDLGHHLPRCPSCALSP